MRAYLQQAFALPTLEAELVEQTIIYLLDHEDEVTNGYAKLNTATREHCVTGTKPIELVRLYARANHTGQGIGSRLLEACFDAARTERHDVIWLGVWEFNPRAVKFYERWGFERVGAHTFHLGSDAQVDWIFQRRL